MGIEKVYWYAKRNTSTPALFQIRCLGIPKIMQVKLNKTFILKKVSFLKSYDFKASRFTIRNFSAL